MKKLVVGVMLFISIILFLFGIYRVNFPGVSIDDLNYKEMNVEITKIVKDEERKYVMFDVNAEKRGVYTSLDTSYNIGDIITVYEFENEFYLSKRDVENAASDSINYIVGSFMIFFGTITFACLSSADYKREEDIEFASEGWTTITKENLEENLEKLDHRMNSTIYPFAFVMWICASGLILCSLFFANPEEVVGDILGAILFLTIGNYVKVSGTIKHKLKKVLNSKGEVFIKDCFFEEKKTEMIYVYEGIGIEYFVKICDANGNAIGEWIEVTKRLYNIVSKETKLKVLMLKKDKLIKFYIVKEKYRGK